MVLTTIHAPVKKSLLNFSNCHSIIEHCKKYFINIRLHCEDEIKTVHRKKISQKKEISQHLAVRHIFCRGRTIWLRTKLIFVVFISLSDLSPICVWFRISTHRPVSWITLDSIWRNRQIYWDSLFSNRKRIVHSYYLHPK